jgi:hypothetical protein
VGTKSSLIDLAPSAKPDFTLAFVDIRTSRVCEEEKS